MSEQEYDVALAHANELFDVVPGTPEGDEFRRLLLVIETYEDEHYPVLTEPKQRIL